MGWNPPPWQHEGSTGDSYSHGESRQAGIWYKRTDCRERQPLTESCLKISHYKCEFPPQSRQMKDLWPWCQGSSASSLMRGLGYSKALHFNHESSTSSVTFVIWREKKLSWMAWCPCGYVEKDGAASLNKVWQSWVLVQLMRARWWHWGCFILKCAA